jgi:hypothetical protein
MSKVKMFREFVESHQGYVQAKMREIEDLISNLKSEYFESELVYNWTDKNGEYLVVNFIVDQTPYRYELDLKKDTPYVVKKFVDNELLFEDELDGDTPEDQEAAGLEVIEKDILNLINEVKGELLERRKSERYKGRKIPGKYLAGPHPGKMKKEIDTYAGKSEYKKEWDADYKSGKGGKGKRVKTKKSAASKAYQKMFGDN